MSTCERDSVSLPFTTAVSFCPAGSCITCRANLQQGKNSSTWSQNRAQHHVSTCPCRRQHSRQPGHGWWQTCAPAAAPSTHGSCPLGPCSLRAGGPWASHTGPACTGRLALPEALQVCLRIGAQLSLTAGPVVLVGCWLAAHLLLGPPCAQQWHICPSLHWCLWHAAAASLLGRPQCSSQASSQGRSGTGKQNVPTLHWAAAALLS